MVAAVKTKKQRITGPDGRFQWVPVDPLPPPLSPRGQAIADLTMDVGLDDDEPQEEWYPRELPDRALMRLYKEPVQYWEPEYPGMSLMPFARLGHFSSTDDGRWVCNTKWEEDAVRTRLARLGDPDRFRVTADELAAIQGKTVVTTHYCHSPLCHFVTVSPLAAQLHSTLRGHTLMFERRKRS